LAKEAAKETQGMLGAFIRSQRTLAELSQRQLADMTNVSNAYLSQLERGLHQPSLRVLSAIADALHIPTEQLLRHAGMMQAAEPGGAREASGGGTIAAIASDEDLSPEDRAVLIRLYQTMRDQTMREGHSARGDGRTEARNADG
jgi:transcriptional regulator with XRE-family HTH domain